MHTIIITTTTTIKITQLPYLSLVENWLERKIGFLHHRNEGWTIICVFVDLRSKGIGLSSRQDESSYFTFRIRLLSINTTYSFVFSSSRDSVYSGHGCGVCSFLVTQSAISNARSSLICDAHAP